VTFFPQLGSLGPWIAAAVYVVLIGLTMVYRFEQGKWRSINLLKNSDRIEAARSAPITIGPPAMEADGAIADLGDHTTE